MTLRFKYHHATVFSLLASPVFLIANSGCVNAAPAGLNASQSKSPLVWEAKQLPLIIVAPDASASEKFAATELATYIGKILNQKIEIQETTSVPTGNRSLLILGHHPLNADLQPQKLGLEESVIEVKGQQVRIVGGREAPITMPDGNTFVRDRGSLYGAYNLLDALGVRWYRPEAWGEYVPSQKRISLAQGKQSFKPVYKYRYGLNGYRWWSDETREQNRIAKLWATRNRQNTSMWTPPEYGGYYQVDFSHAYGHLVPPAQYFEKHPEYFALFKGKRTNDPLGQLALGNPDVQNLVAEKIIAQAKANPMQEIFSLEPNDSWLWGDEPETVALDDPNLKAASGGGVSMTNRVSTFGNIVAQKVAKEVPHAKVGWLAYQLHTEVPTKARPIDPNVVVQVASQTAAYSDYSKLLHDPTSKANARFLKTLQGWGGLTQIMVHDYFSGYAWYGPMPLLTTMTDRFRSYRKYNVTGVYSEMHPSWGSQGMSLYFYTRLLWNPDMNVQKEANLYYRNYYGPAAAEMKAYHELLEKGSTKAYWGAGGINMEDLFTSGFVAQLQPHITKARALVKGKAPYEQRLEGDWAGFEFARRLRAFIELKKQDKIIEAAAELEGLEKFILSFKDGDVFDNGPAMYPFISQPFRTMGQDVVERSRLMQQFENPVISQKLDQGWRFQTDASNAGVANGWATPESKDETWPLLNADKHWQEQGFPDYRGTAWYRKQFTAPNLKDGQRLILYFGAIDGDAVVYINGKNVGGRNLGKDGDGWDKPFFLDITEATKAGQLNQIAISVRKENYVGGIWKGVQLLLADRVLPVKTPYQQLKAGDMKPISRRLVTRN